MKNGLLIVVIILVLIGGVIFFRNFASNSAIPKPTPVTKQKEDKTYNQWPEFFEHCFIVAPSYEELRTLSLEVFNIFF